MGQRNPETGKDDPDDIQQKGDDRNAAAGWYYMFPERSQMSDSQLECLQSPRNAYNSETKY